MRSAAAAMTRTEMRLFMAFPPPSDLKAGTRQCGNGEPKVEERQKLAKKRRKSGRVT